MATNSRLTHFDLLATRFSNASEPQNNAIENFTASVTLTAHEIEALQTVLDDTFLGYAGVIVNEDGFDYDCDGDSCKMYDPAEVVARLLEAVSNTIVFTGEVHIMCDDDLKSSRQLIVTNSLIDIYQPADIVWERIF